MANFLNDQHDLVSKVKEMAIELGRAPKRDEFCAKYGYGYRTTYKSYSVLVKAAALDEVSVKAEHKNELKDQLKIKCKKIESFDLYDASHVLDFSKKDVLKFIVQPDTHFGHQDDQALAVLLDFAKDYNPDGHIILGDFLDMNPISHWGQDKLEEEYLVDQCLEARQFLSSFKYVTPNCTYKYFNAGNHEDWLRQYLVKNVRHLANRIHELGIEITVQSLLDLNKYGYEYIPFNAILKVLKAHFTHGLYTSSSHAKTHLDKLKGNIYYGHLHDYQCHSQMSLSGVQEAASLGCLSKLDAPFLRGKPNNWMQGFAVFEFMKDGNFSWSFMRIIDGKFSYNGKVYT